MLGLTIGDMLKFDKQVANICRKVCQQVAVLKRIRNVLPFDIRILTCHLLYHISIAVHKPGFPAIRVRLENWRK